MSTATENRMDASTIGRIISKWKDQPEALSPVLEAQYLSLSAEELLG